MISINYKSFELWNKLLNKGVKVIGISGRDWHNIEEQESEPIPKTFVHADSLSERGIIEGLRRGHVFVSSGPRLFFSAKYKNKRYECGDEIKFTEGKSLNFQVKIEDLEEPCKLQVIKNGLKFFNAYLTEGENQNIKFSDLPEYDSWYRCEIYKETDKALLCFTNPIRIY